MLYGAIEAGGTKFVCAVGNEKLDIIEKVNFTTLSPKETMPQVISFFHTTPGFFDKSRYFQFS